MRKEKGKKKEGIKEEKMVGGRGAIMRGRRLIEGWLLFEEIRYDIKCHSLMHLE